MWLIVGFIVVGLAIDIAFICSEYAGKMAQATVLKGAASLMFVLLGIYLYTGCRSAVGMLIVIGLFLGMVGDIFLNLRHQFPEGTGNKIFAVGILAFLAGHFLYIAALIQNAASHMAAGRVVLYALILTAILAVLGIPPLIRSITAPSQGLKLFGYVYLTVVIGMFSFASSALAALGASAFTVIFTVGAGFFVVSDFIMIYFSFGKKIKPLRAINLLTYYAGQILIALCIMMLA